MYSILDLHFQAYIPDKDGRYTMYAVQKWTCPSAVHPQNVADIELYGADTES